MAKFSDLGIESDVVVGKSIDMDELFGKRILIEKVIIQPTKFPGKNVSGLRMQMQIVIATFQENGEYVKRADGLPEGEKAFMFHWFGQFDWSNPKGGSRIA